MKRKAMTQKTKKTTTGTSKKRRTGGDYQKGRELLGTPKQELKAFDVTRTVTAAETIAGPPTFQTLNALVNGAELYQRVGRKTYMKTLRFRAEWIPNAAGAASDYGRIIIYFDAQPNKGAPLIADLIQDSTAGAATTVFSEINLINRQRFKILRDMPFLLPIANGASEISGPIPDTVKQSLQIDEFIKLNGLETVYNATNGGTVADISSGSIGFVVLQDQDTNYSLIWSTRLRYYD